MPLAKMDFESILSKVSDTWGALTQIGRIGGEQFEMRVTFLLQLRTLLGAVEQLGQSISACNSKILGALQRVC
jgi:hypothetical protein